MAPHAQILETARLAARAGSDVVERYFRDSELEVRAKAKNDFVTQADQESEQAILEVIARDTPSTASLPRRAARSAPSKASALGSSTRSTATTNFMHGLPIFAVSVACWEGNRPIAAVVLEPAQGNEFAAAAGAGATWNDRPMRVSDRPGLDGAFVATGFPFRAHRAIDLYLALFRAVFVRAKSIRRPGAAALDLAYTAAGVYDGFFEFRLGPWDVGAGTLLIREAGGLVTDLDGGDDFLSSGNIVAGSPAVHSELLEEVAALTSEAHLETVAPLAEL